MRNKPSLAKIFVISGPSGCGKTTLLKRLAKSRTFRNTITKIITVTTRLSRRGERSGRDYFFVSEKEFLRRKNKNDFAEWQEVFGNFYGTPKKELIKELKNGRDVLLCIDVKGALAIRKIFPKEAVLIFITAPDAETLKSRLHQRSTEHRHSLRRRLKVAEQEMACRKNYDHCIVNHEVASAVKELKGIIEGERKKALAV